MNEKRRKKTFSVGELILLGIGAIILATGGVMHAYAKNKQVDIARKVDAAKKEIIDLEEKAAFTRVEIERLLDRHEMKLDLGSINSLLRPTDPGQLIIVKPEADGTATASSN